MTEPAAHMPPHPETISAEARAMLAMMLAAPQPPTVEMAQMRAGAEMIQQAIGAEQRKAYDVTVTDDVIAGVNVRRIVPAGGSKNPAKVLLNVHGGGFATDSGSLTENIPVAALAGVEVVAVIYRLAPEHPFPAAVDDALAVYKAMLEGRQAADIAVYGTSAGAVIGPQLMMRLTAEGLPLPAALGVYSGEPDMVGTADSLRIFARQAEGQALIDAKLAYVAGGDPTDPMLSPIYGDLAFFPPTQLISSGRDVLLSGTVNLHRKLSDAGVPADLVVYDALPHAFWAYLLCPESDDCFRRMARFLKRSVGA